MQRSVKIMKRGVFTIVAMLVSLTFPSAAGLTAISYADSCDAPASSDAGVHYPTGSDAGTYKYRCSGTYAGEWTNDYYVYNPATQVTSPLYDPQYSYDCGTNQWMMTRYDYNAPGNNYYSVRVKATTTPDQTTGCPVAAATPTQTGGQGSSGTTTSSNGNGAGSAISGTGNGSSNTSSNNLNGTLSTANNNNFTMINGLGSQAGTGNIVLSGNTSAGNATTGDATSIATVANMLQSTSNVFGPNTATFTANINGDVNGDFMFDPSAIMNTGASSSNNTSNNANLTVNQANNTNATMNNTVNIGSKSGDATVADNTIAGDTKTGDANTIVNLMNMINSTVSAGQSFVGTININGNLNGDILLPQSLLDEILATGAGSDNTTTNNLNVNDTATNNTNTAINNNVNATANSGNATADGNTVSGNVTTGNAKTNVTLLNLTGSSVVGADDLLVFVNVLGHWVGMIMNAPAGTTSASLGGGISQTGNNSKNSSSNNINVNANSTTNNNLGINNTVNASAQSGNADVDGNTRVGNITTGNAKTAVNVLNIANTSLDLSKWFGVLFINVFGSWTGSFGVNTSAGNQNASSANATGADTNGTTVVAAPVLASFIPNSIVSSNASGNTTTTSNSTTGNATLASVLGTQTTKQSAKAMPAPDNKAHADYTLPAIGIGIAILMLAGERIVAVRKAHKA